MSEGRRSKHKELPFWVEEILTFIKYNTFLHHQVILRDSVNDLSFSFYTY